MNLPKSLQKIADFFNRLPGIGQKTANRLSLYLLQMPQEDINDFSEALHNLKNKVKKCKICLNLTEEDICSICQNPERDKGTIMVVETPLDILSFEAGKIYNGVYHVLYGKIDPLNHIGPEDIFINELITRLEQTNGQLKEVILATNPDMEGEATAMYIKDKIKSKNINVKVTRLGYGLPIGANIEYADYMTLQKSITRREEYE